MRIYLVVEGYSLAWHLAVVAVRGQLMVRDMVDGIVELVVKRSFVKEKPKVGELSWYPARCLPQRCCAWISNVLWRSTFDKARNFIERSYSAGAHGLGGRTNVTTESRPGVSC